MTIFLFEIGGIGSMHSVKTRQNPADVSLGVLRILIMLSLQTGVGIVTEEIEALSRSTS